MIHVNLMEVETAASVSVMPVAEFGGRAAVEGAGSARVVEIEMSSGLTLAMLEWQAEDLLQALLQALPDEGDDAGNILWKPV